LFLCILVGLSASVALAQEGAEGHGQAAEGGSHELLWKWANFAILAGGLGYLAYKKGGAYYRARGEAIRRGIEEADRLRAEATARVAEMEERLKNLSAEVESLRQAAHHEMAAENERLRREAEERLRRIQEQAEQEIAAAVKAARREVQARAAELAVGLAAGKIRSMLDAQTDQALVIAYLEELERAAGGHSGKELH
jgi:F-type H+-transporting ATPase subunit b